MSSAMQAPMIDQVYDVRSGIFDAPMHMMPPKQNMMVARSMMSTRGRMKGRSGVASQKTIGQRPNANQKTATTQLNRPGRNSQFDGRTVLYMAGPILLLANLSRRLPRWISGLTWSPVSLITLYGLLFSSSSTTGFG